MKTDRNNLAFAGGAVLLVAGIVMVLMWWPDVVSVFRGFSGMIFAIAGLILMQLKK